jgi:hypothetical protein
LRRTFAVAAVLAQGVTLVPFLLLCSASDVRRNFFEHTTAPVFLPLRAAVRDATRAPGFEKVNRLKLLGNMIPVVPGYVHWVEPVAYPDLSRRFAFDNRLGNGKPDDCCCTAPDEAVVGLFVYFTGLSPREVRPPAEAMAQACLAQMRRGCASVRLLQEGGQTIAAVGFGIR